MGWQWNTEDGLSDTDPGLVEDGTVRWDGTVTKIEATLATPRTMESLKSELLSEVATRSIFSWLRVDGYPPTEKDIFTHDWFDVGSSSEESVATDDSPPGDGQSDINGWLNTIDENKT